MSEQAEQQQNEEFQTLAPETQEIPEGVGVDLLENLDSIDLTTVDRSFPVIKDVTVKMVIDKFEPKQNKAKTGHNLVVHLKTAQECTTEENKKLKEGFPFTHNISLVKIANYNPAEQLADIQNAVYGRQQQGFRFEDYVGQEVLVRFKIVDDKEYGRQNKLVRFIPRKKTVAATL